MVAFLVRRGVPMVLSVWMAVTLVFVAVTQLPGDPVRALFGFKPPPPEIYAAIRNQFHLDEPLLVQYGLYLRDLVAGDWGRSYPLDPYGDAGAGATVVSVVLETAPVSALLLAGALLIQVVAGVVSGAVSAARGSATGPWVYAASLLLVSIPVVVSAYALRTAFGSQLRWLPVSGASGTPLTYVLPVLALAALSTGYVALLTRAELRETLSSAYVKAARARGLRPWRVVGVHGLRPSLIPVVAFVAANVAQLFVGLVIVEGIFSMPGLGGALFEAIKDRDRSLLVGLVTVVMVTVIVANAAADVLAAALDPRVTLEAAS